MPSLQCWVKQQLKMFTLSCAMSWPYFIDLLFIYWFIHNLVLCKDSKGKNNCKHLTSTGHTLRSSSPRSPIVRNKLSANVTARPSSPRSPVVRKKVPTSSMFPVSRRNPMINFTNFISDLKTEVIFVQPVQLGWCAVWPDGTLLNLHNKLTSSSFRR